MNAATEVSPSEEIRSNLSHPVLDCDGHYIEFMPHYFDFVEQVGGLSLVETKSVRKRSARTASAKRG